MGTPCVVNGNSGSSSSLEENKKRNGKKGDQEGPHHLSVVPVRETVEYCTLSVFLRWKKKTTWLLNQSLLDNWLQMKKWSAQIIYKTINNIWENKYGINGEKESAVARSSCTDDSRSWLGSFDSSLSGKRDVTKLEAPGSKYRWDKRLWGWKMIREKGVRRHSSGRQAPMGDRRRNKTQKKKKRIEKIRMKIFRKQFQNSRWEGKK